MIPREPALTQGATAEDAVFLGWQYTLSGVAVALYNVTAIGHPSHGSTVTDRSLRRMGLRTPDTPVSWEEPD